MARSSSLAQDVTERTAHVGYFQLKDIEVVSSMDRLAADVHFTLGSISAIVLKSDGGTKGASSHGQRAERTHFNLLRPVPPTPILFFSYQRALQTKVFRAWRTLANNGMNQLRSQIADGSLDFRPAQIYGHFSRTETQRVVSVVTSFLVVSLDDKVLQQCLEFAKDNLDALQKVCVLWIPCDCCC